jgi:phenylacetic acid degradation operon negative regulatory protein
MVDRGELARDDDGTYRLRGPLLERQRRQEAGLDPDTRPWNGGWEIHVVRTGGRDSGDRASLRRAARRLGLGERRDGVWLRPDNLDPNRLANERAVLADQADRFLGAPDDGIDPSGLAADLFELDSWAEVARGLGATMDEMTQSYEADPDAPLAAGFVLAAEVLRHLIADPRLPPQLCPGDWPAPRLRAAYREYDVAYRQRLSAFFRSRSRLTR